MAITRSNSLQRPARRTLFLIVGDALAFIVFAAIGRRSHGEAAGLAAVSEVLLTAAPFMVAWFLVAPWLRAYDATVTASPRAMVLRTLLAWLVALPLGLGLRALIIGRFSPPSFAIVTFLAVCAILGGWRSAFAWLDRRGTS
ncbi:DUF3054 domain-containing protein [Candidatus Gracilibacteria bacterium]|nr:DUF3054 domain-containing protein [Candidatus Gracilibacteria bacterium]